LVNKE
jgi:hypothetical protein